MVRLSSFQRRFTPAKRSAAAAGVFGIAGASLFGATPAVAADFECDELAGFPAPTLVADGVCEIIITAAEAPEPDNGDDPTTFVFPGTLGAIQAVLVGAGGGGVEAYGDGAYGGGGGQVVFIDEVAVDSEIGVVIGTGGEGAINDWAEDGGESFFIADPTDPIIANGGKGAEPWGGGNLVLWDNEADENDGIFWGDDEFFNDDAWYYLGGGAGAAGDADGAEPGPGYFLSDLVAEFGADAELFPAEADTFEYGRGGEGFAEFVDSPVIFDSEPAEVDLPASLDAPAAATGQGGNASLYLFPLQSEPTAAAIIDIPHGDATDGADGALIIRYGAAELAATGVDATAALGAGAIAAAAGAGLVALTARRRRVAG